MVDISPYINRTVAAIDEWWRKKGDAERVDFYPTLRASQLGDECDRKLWYIYHWCLPGESFSGRMYRLFDRGHREEDRFIRALEGIGVTVFNQQEEVSALDGRLTGHIDGQAIGVPEAPKTVHVLEFKTFNDKTFKELKSKGVEGAKFQHFVQLQIYMFLLGIDRALYLAINKNDDEIYQERIELNRKFAESQIARGKRIIEAQEPPARISEKPEWFKCKYCPAWSICHGGKDWKKGR